MTRVVLIHSCLTGDVKVKKKGIFTYEVITKPRRQVAPSLSLHRINKPN